MRTLLRTSTWVALAAACLASRAAAQDLHTGLVSYWPLDVIDGTGKTPDLAGGNDLEGLNLDAGALVPGKVSNAVTFNGFDQMFTLIHAGGDNRLPVYSLGEYTVALWVRGDGLGQSDRRVFAEGSTSDNDPLLTLGTDSGAGSGSLDVYLRNDGAGVLLSHVKTTAEPFDGDWHHIAWVDNNGSVQVYIDGAPDETFTYTRGTLTMDTLSIGGIQRAEASHFFAGEIDEVAVWERALTPAEVQALVTGGIPQPVPDLPPAILTQPSGMEVVGGTQVELRAKVVGKRPMTLQWYHNNAAIPGETNAVLAFPATPDRAGTYRLEATNANGTTSSVDAVLTVVVDPPPDLQDGLVAWWPFESISGDSPPVTFDSYSGLPMTLVDMDASSLVPGPSGNALSFDGASQVAIREGGFPVTNLPAYTIAFRVNAAGAGNADLRLFAEGSLETNTPLFAIGTHINGDDDTIRIFSRSARNTTVLNLNSTIPALDGTWRHITFVDNNGAARLYIDGIPDGTDFSHIHLPSLKDTTSLGAIVRAAVSHYLTCSIDDLALWSRPLTFTEVQKLVAEGVPPPPGQRPPFVTLAPVDTAVYAGMPVTLRVEAAGKGPLSYQWKRGAETLPGMTSPVLELPAATVADAGVYTVEITGADGLTSASAELTVHPVDGLTTALISYWPFDSIAATTPDPVSGNDMTAMFMSEANVVDGPPGQGKALFFDGFESMLVREAGNGLPIYRPGGYTVALWVNGSWMQDRRIFSESSSTANNPLLNIGADSADEESAGPYIDIFLRNDEGTSLINHRKSGASAIDETWHHVAWVDHDGNAVLYIDGIPDDTNFSYDPIGTFSFDRTTIGGIQRAAASHWFTGAIDEVAVWARPLQPAEVLALKENGLSVSPSPSGAAPVVQLVELLNGGTRVRIEFTADPGHPSKSAETAVDPAGPWGPVANPVIAPGEGANRFVAEFDAGPAGSRRYYRIRTGP